jgi:hypothetical protein
MALRAREVPPRGEVGRALGGRFRLMYPRCAEWPDGLDGLGATAVEKAANSHD